MDSTDNSNNVNLLIKDIETFFENNKNHDYEFNKYTIVEMDQIQIDINIRKDNKKYYYVFNAKNFWYYDEKPCGGNEIDLYKSGYFHTIFQLLKHLEFVQHNYHFFDNILCSSKQKEKIIKLKKTLSFFPQKEDNECSICYEPTKQVTVCNHPICLHCRESCILLQNDNCPICRGSKLYHYPYDPLFIL